jgi:LacI family transcriptional regulator
MLRRRPAPSAVLPDEEGGGYVAARRLLDAGHRADRPGQPGGSHAGGAGQTRWLSTGPREAGIAHDPALITHADATSVGGYESASKLLDLPRRPTALFCCTDRMATGAYDAIKERGLSIPGHVAVIGFDNQIIIAEQLRPALTTVALPFEEMGARSVALLVAALANEEIPPVTVLDCQLIGRESV